jgi:hypothetical protein
MSQASSYEATPLVSASNGGCEIENQLSSLTSTRGVKRDEQEGSEGPRRSRHGRMIYPYSVQASVMETRARQGYAGGYQTVRGRGEGGRRRAQWVGTDGMAMALCLVSSLCVSSAAVFGQRGGSSTGSAFVPAPSLHSRRALPRWGAVPAAGESSRPAFIAPWARGPAAGPAGSRTCTRKPWGKDAGLRGGDLRFGRKRWVVRSQTGMEDTMPSSPEPVSPLWGDWTDIEVKAATVIWVNRMVIGLDLCPFALGSMPGLRVIVSKALDKEQALDEVAVEMGYLVQQPKNQPATTLIVFPMLLFEQEDENGSGGDGGELALNEQFVQGGSLARNAAAAAERYRELKAQVPAEQLGDWGLAAQGIIPLGLDDLAQETLLGRAGGSSEGEGEGLQDKTGSPQAMEDQAQEQQAKDQVLDQAQEQQVLDQKEEAEMSDDEVPFWGLRGDERGGSERIITAPVEGKEEEEVSEEEGFGEEAIPFWGLRGDEDDIDLRATRQSTRQAAGAGAGAGAGGRGGGEEVEEEERAELAGRLEELEERSHEALALYQNSAAPMSMSVYEEEAEQDAEAIAVPPPNFDAFMHFAYDASAMSQVSPPPPPPSLPRSLPHLPSLRCRFVSKRSSSRVLALPSSQDEGGPRVLAPYGAISLTRVGPPFIPGFMGR